MSDGLYPKYRVTKISDGSTVINFFVLRPERDVHAQVALRYYADSVAKDNPTLSKELHAWMDSLACEHLEMPDDRPCEWCNAYPNCPVKARVRK
jgi:hypothetical protein